MFHVRRRPADTGHTRRRKKKPLGISNGNNNLSTDREGPALVEVTHSGDGGKRVKLTSDPLEVLQNMNFTFEPHTYTHTYTHVNIHSCYFKHFLFVYASVSLSFLYS